MTREKDILYENGGFWVMNDGPRGYTVQRPSPSFTHSLPDSTYAPDANGLSLAKARCDYLARRGLGS